MCAICVAFAFCFRSKCTFRRLGRSHPSIVYTYALTGAHRKVLFFFFLTAFFAHDDRLAFLQA